MEMSQRLAVVLVRDLMLRSKIRETVQGIDQPVVFARSPEEAIATMGRHTATPETKGLLVVDLGQFHAALPTFGPFLSVSNSSSALLWDSVGFYSHVQTDVMAAAKEAGIKVVVPRSKFFSSIEAFFLPP